MAQKSLKSAMGAILLILILILPGFLIIMPMDSRLNAATAASTWIQSSDKNFKNGTMDNLTIVGTKEDAELRIDLSEIKTWSQKTPVPNPGRYDHKMAPIFGTDKVVLFGGNAGRNETWVYDLSGNKWTNKKPMTCPSTRVYFSLASLYGDDKAILYGGYHNSIRYNETWVYDLSNNTWTEKEPSNSPTWRYYHGMASIYGKDKVLIFGGLPQNSETWVYDYGDNQWTKMADAPFSQSYHAITSVYKTDKVILFGGGTGSGDETWVYDLSKDKWTKKSPKNRPYARFYHGMSSICGTDNVMLFGGRDWPNQFFNDTWIYDLSDDNWTFKVLETKPSARQSPSMAPIYGTDKVVLFGGTNAFYDTWIYEHILPTKNGTFISAPYDTGSSSSFKSLNWLAKIPTNTSIKFQLRSAFIEQGLFSKDFMGPDGSISTFYESSPSSIWSGHNGDRWIQLIAYFNIDIFTDSPSLNDVKISYNCLPNTIVIGPVNGSLLTNNKPVFVWTFNDHDSEYQKAFQVLIDDDIEFEDVRYDSYEQTTSAERWEFPMGTNYTELPDGMWYWKVRTSDADGDWTDYSIPWTFTIDTNPPTSSPTKPVNNGFYNSLNTISGMANDATSGSGVEKVEIAIKRLSDNKYWDGANWASFSTWFLTSGTSNWTYDSSNIPWGSGFKYTIQSRATDFATNIEQSDSGNIFSIDVERPASKIVSPIDNIWLNNLDNISGNAVDIGGSGVNRVDICIKCTNNNNYWMGSKWESNECWLSAEGAYQWSYDTSKISWPTGNRYIIRTRATDNAKNIEIYGEGNVLWFDNQPPESLSIHINNGDEYTKSRSVVLSLQSEDFDSGISQMSFSNNGIDWSEWGPYNTTRLIDLPTLDGEKCVYFKVQDYAGNIAEPVFDTIILDTSIPEIISIKINGNSKYTNSRNVTLNLKATDSLSGIKDMSFSYDGISWTSWESFNHERSFTLPPNDGKKIIYFKVCDSAGNIAFTTGTIILDTTPPHSLSILINEGSSETKSTTVTLKLNAVDETSSIYQMSFSTNGNNWTLWEPFNHESSFTLPPKDGEKIVYFMVMDAAGNIAKPESTAIYLNTQPKGKEAGQTKAFLFSMEFWVILIIMIIIFLIMTGWVIKPMVREEQKLLPDGSVTIKSGGIFGPIVSLEQIQAQTKLSELPGTGTEPSDAQQITTPTPVPTLVKSTQTTYEHISAQPAQVPQLPQLPPAKLQVTRVKNGETAQVVQAAISTPTPKSAILVQGGTPTITTAPTTQPTSTLPSIATSSSKPSVQEGATPNIQVPQNKENE